MVGYIFGGDTGAKSPEDLKRQRDLVRALMGAQRAPQNVGEGLNALGDGIVANVLGRRADEAEKSGLESASASWNNLSGAVAGPSAFPSAPGGATASASASATPQSPGGDAIRAKLVERGLPEHVADAFVMNFQDESGLNPGINEANPTVPGSRGGFGLYQLTGPRRVAYEKFAAERGVNPADTDAQLDFMMMEGQGSEKAAFDAILSAPDRGTAAAAIVNKFLRPAEEHRASREARYLRAGGGPVQVASNDPTSGIAQALAGAPQGGQPSVVPGDTPGGPAATTPAGQRVIAQMLNKQPIGGSPQPMQQITQALGGGQPAQPVSDPQQHVAQEQDPNLPVMAGGSSGAITRDAQGGPDLQMLMGAAGNEWMNPTQQNIIQSLLGQRLDPNAALDTEYKRAQIDALKRKEEEGFTLGEGQIRYDAQGNKIAAGGEKAPDLPADVKEYQYYEAGERAAGRPPLPYNDWRLQGKKAGATSVVTNVGEGDKFYENLDKKNAETFSALSDEGLRGRGKLAQIDRLEGLMAAAPQGAVGALKQAAGEYGINTEGLSDIQAAQALINELVPQQRQPGSGPMSDADLALFKQSLPRLINQPGGNKMILDTMRGITQYQIKMGEIADAVADRDMSPKQGREAIRALANPLAEFGKVSKAATPGQPVTIDGFTIEEVQ